MFLSHFKLESSQKKSSGYLLVDPQGIVKDISTFIYSFFDISKEEVKRGELSVEEIIPNVLGAIDEYSETKNIDVSFREMRERCGVTIERIIATKSQDMGEDNDN